MQLPTDTKITYIRVLLKLCAIIQQNVCSNRIQFDVDVVQLVVNQLNGMPCVTPRAQLNINDDIQSIVQCVFANVRGCGSLANAHAHETWTRTRIANR